MVIFNYTNLNYTKMINKINNSRAHVWTKAEFKITVNQCKEAGFTVEKNTPFPGSTLIKDGDYIFLEAIKGLSMGLLVKVDTSYFNYSE